jgi:5'-nucleotidase (lipoprotein e(P4) family)
LQKTIMIQNTLWALGFALLSAGCSARQNEPSVAINRATDDRLDAILWQTTSAEYQILAQSIYASAAAHLERALADRRWTALSSQVENSQTLPPAVIMDIDETVLDTGRFQSHLVKTGARFSTPLWRDWLNQNHPSAVPGALEFISLAQSRGVSVFFVTNRDHATEPVTRIQLASVGIALPANLDTVLSANERPDWGVDKNSRRQFIGQSYRVLMVFGDDLGDFVSEYRTAPHARVLEAKKHNSWGTKWFMLPNPMYGSWETSLYNFSSELKVEEISRRKLQHLR